MNNEANDVAQAIEWLRNPRTIRNQAQAILALAKQDQLSHFALHQEQMVSTADYVIAVITELYPKLDIPYHSRWRHFEVGQTDRVQTLLAQCHPLTAEEQGKMLYELVLISVFLDAGAGQHWQFKEYHTDKSYARSEGLALASLSLYQSGMLSEDQHNPLRVDAQRLMKLTETDLRAAFQVTDSNPLTGLAGRVALLNRLGKVISDNSDFFGRGGRLGDFYIYVSGLAKDQHIAAESIFQAVLKAFTPIWPARQLFHGIALGDVWKHSALQTQSLGSEFIPFHKLSQWLTYSLIEPLEQSGLVVTDLDVLTGLPEYRNGGLLVDMGLLQLKDKQAIAKPMDPGAELVVEWRALTVALLDELAAIIRNKLHKDAQTLPLAKILQGGTWEAGRRIAKQLRNKGEPPIQIISDGTLF